jgi:hypothetical protein
MSSSTTTPLSWFLSAMRAGYGSSFSIITGLGRVTMSCSSYLRLGVDSDLAHPSDLPTGSRNLGYSPSLSSTGQRTQTQSHSRFSTLTMRIAHIWHLKTSTSQHPNCHPHLRFIYLPPFSLPRCPQSLGYPPRLPLWSRVLERPRGS